jgi:hypothetical protein
MPTKPAGVYSVATDLNYSSGVATGFPTKSATVSATEGFFPDTAIAAEEQNYLWNLTGEWTSWLFAGTSLPVIDTTIVERDALGRSQFAIVQAGNTASPSIPVIVDGNAGQPAGDPAVAINSNTGSAASATSASSDPTMSATNGSDGIGVLAITSAGPAGVQGQSATAAPSVGVEGVSRGPASIGVLGRGDATLGALPGVAGVALADNGIGVYGQVSATAGITAAGVQGDATLSSDAVGVWGLAAGGYGVQAQSDQTAPQRAALRLVPQDTDPVIAGEGDTYHNLTGYRRIFADSLWRSVTTQPGNTVRAFEVTPGPVAIPLVPTLVVSATLGLNNQPLVGGELEIYVELQPAWGTSSLSAISGLTVTLRDTTAAVDVWSQVLSTPAAPAAGVVARTFARTVRYTLPGTGPRGFEVLVERTTGADNAEIFDAVLKIDGVY